MEIEVPEKYTSNAVFLSGGADSAILLYLLAKIIAFNGNRMSLTAYTIPRTDGAANYSPDIVNWINKKLKINVQGPILVGDPSVDHTVVVREPVVYILYKGYHDNIYLAENQIPPEGQLPSTVTPPSRTTPTEGSKVKFPFANLTKDNVMSLYYSEGVTELLTLTHSCTDRTVGRCNTCFNCLERAWAFKQLNQTDPGTL